MKFICATIVMLSFLPSQATQTPLFYGRRVAGTAIPISPVVDRSQAEVLDSGAAVRIFDVWGRHVAEISEGGSRALREIPQRLMP